MAKITKILALIWTFCALLTMAGAYALVDYVPYLSYLLKDSAYRATFGLVLDIGFVLTTGGLLTLFFFLLFKKTDGYAVIRKEEGGSLEMETSFFERLALIPVKKTALVYNPHVRVSISKANEGTDAVSLIIEGDLDPDTRPEDFVDTLRSDIVRTVRATTDLDLKEVTFRFRPLERDPSGRRVI